ncbi:MAG: FKBP-type peptidyl-prolyl cis-trans isomerase [Cyclobacteriaceae bacterium]|nr:FKBP-type peptidyl-prolyl cis-trans isomerase [Cyclobacteriaceae bacterium]
MKKSFLLSVCVAGLLMACSKTKETPSGLKYTVLRAGTEGVAENGQIMILSFLFKDNKDSVWNDSRQNPFPAMFKKDSAMSSDPVMEVVQLLGKGDSVSFSIPAQTLFAKAYQPLPPGVDSTTTFTFFVGVTDVVTEERAREMQNEYIAKQNEEAVKAEKEQLAKDTLAIDLFLKEKAIVAQKTASGLRYIISKPGVGATAQAGQQVKVNYVGTLLDGTYFDSSIESVAKANNAYNAQRAPYEPLQLTLGTQSVIPGWEEALTLMNKGSKMTVYIPSTLAYGNRRRSEVIAENSILVFEMELVDIVKAK